MKEKIRILIFVIILGTVSAGLLVGINSYTTPLVTKNEEIKLKSSILDTFELDYNRDNIFPVFADNIEVLKKGDISFYFTRDKSTAFEFLGSGLWGPISGIISLNPDLQTIKNIKVLHQEETPGLGGRIVEKEFLGQFKGKEFTGGIKVEAITGATGSSRAFEKLLNENLKNKVGLIQTQ